MSYTEFFEYVKSGNILKASLYLERLPDLNEKDDAGYTLLHLAVIKDSWDASHLLLSQGADVNSRCDFMDKTSLHLACFFESTHHQIIDLLLIHGADTLSLDSYGQTPLHLACYHGNKEHLERLLKSKRDIDGATKNSRKFTPLMCAIWRKDINFVKTLISAGADVNFIVHAHGVLHTPMHVAAQVGCLEIVQILDQCGARKDIVDIEGNTAVDLALDESVYSYLTNQEAVS